MTLWRRRIFLATVCIVGLFSAYQGSYAQVQTGIANDDQSLDNEAGSTLVRVPVLNNDLADAESPWNPASIQLVHPSTFDLVDQFVEADQGIWEVDLATGEILFYPCTGVETPDISCTGPLKGNPWDISYQVANYDGDLSNEAFVTVTFETPALNVTLVYFSSTRIDANTEFVWVTATETGTAGFNLLVETDTGLARINDELVPSTGGDSIVPQRYTYQAAVEGDVFWIQEVSIDGATRVDGPFALGESYGEDPTTDGGQNDRYSVYLPLVNSPASQQAN